MPRAVFLFLLFSLKCNEKREHFLLLILLTFPFPAGRWASVFWAERLESVGHREREKGRDSELSLQEGRW